MSFLPFAARAAIGTAIILSSVLPARAVVLQPGDPGVYQYGNSLYKFVDGPTWHDAEANAVLLGGHLVTINDDAENTWLHDTFQLNPYWDRSSDNEAYGGLYRETLNSAWQWISGEPVTYTNWGSNEPSNGPGELYLGLGWSEYYTWNDTVEDAGAFRTAVDAWPYQILLYQGIAEIPYQPPTAFGAPGPLPLFGAAAAFGFSRKLRKRIGMVNK